jgi:sulfide:quinone oxidoreductase
VPAEILILGGGVGGTLTANLLAAELSEAEARIRIVDATGRHQYQPGWLDLALGQADSRWLSRDLRGLLHDRVELLIDNAMAMNHDRQTVYLERQGPVGYDHAVVATGARIDLDAVPGLDEGTHNFYSLDGAQRLREALRGFRGGTLLLGVAGMPYKCPTAPLEFAFLAEEYLRKRGVRDRTTIKFLSPVNRALPLEGASELITPLLEGRGIELHTLVNVEGVDGADRTVTSLEGESFPYDLAVLVPPHAGSRLAAESGVADAGGWLPTDPSTLEVRGAGNLFALGDATDLPISKSGSTAHHEAPVIAHQIASRVRAHAPDPNLANYQGQALCFLEVGGRKATALRFDYEGVSPTPQPSARWWATKWLLNRVYWYTVPVGRGLSLSPLLFR